MLSVISHLREQPINSENVWKKNFWIPNLNYLNIAKAALECGAYFSAICYVDIWCQEKKNL